MSPDTHQAYSLTAMVMNSNPLASRIPVDSDAHVGIEETARFSPFYLLYGRDPQRSIDVSLRQGAELSQEAKDIVERVHAARKVAVERIKEAQRKQKSRFDERHRHVEYAVGQLVKVFSPTRQVKKSDKLQHRWHGPYKVISKRSDVNYEVAIKKGRKIMKDVIHVIRMKPFFEPDKWRRKALSK